MKNRLRSILFNKAALLGIATFAVVAGAFIGVTAKKVSASDCSSNAIIHCGTSSPSDYIGKVKSSNGGTQSDLATIYADYGLTSAQYNQFVTSARPGTAYKNGTIVVDGKTVATGAQSIGRSSKSYSHPKVINGHTYYESRAQDVFLSNSIGVMAFFNTNGDFQFAVMYDCGNPTVGTPTYACNNLNETKIDRDTFQFSTKASATNGANVSHVVYDFGDGSAPVSQTNPKTVVTHNYTKAGIFNAKVTVYVTLPGGKSTVIAAAGECVKKIVVAPAPVASCTSLTAAVLDRTTVRLTAKAATANGASVQGYDFSIKDAAGKVVVTKSVNGDGLSTAPYVSVTTPGAYAATVAVRTSIGTVTAPACKASFTIKAAPIASCVSLDATVLDRTTVRLTAKAATANGASVQGYDFTIKNAAGKVVVTKSANGDGLSTAPYVSVTTPGTYSASVSVRTTIGTVTAPKCNDTFTIAPAPAVACTALTAIAIDRTHYTLKAAASATNGATISHYSFVVRNAAGTSVAAPIVTTAAATATTPVIALTTAGTYSAQVTVTTSLGAVTSAGCKTTITVKPLPVAACTSLHAITIDRTNYTLNAAATVSGGATIQGYDFTVKDASGKVVTSPSVATTATTASQNVVLATADTYSASVSVRTSAGAQTGPQCQTKITVPPAPVTACVSLTATAIDRLDYKLVATASAANGATIQGYDFTVKDASGKVVTSPSVASTTTTASTNVGVMEAGTYSASVSVRTSAGAQTGPQCATSFTVKALPPSVKIEKHVDGVKLEQVALNQTFTYQLVVTNNGQVDLHNVAVTDPAPEGVTMISSDQGTVSGNAWSFTIPSLAVNQVVKFNITAKVTAYHANPMVNQACVNAPEVNPGQPNLPDSCDTATVTTTPPTPKNPNITIVKTVDGQKSEQVAVGQTFTYKLVVTNKGEIDLTNVAVTDQTPSGVTLLTADQGTIADNNWTATIASLKVGESATFTITANAAAYVPGSLVNTACVNAPEVNPTQPDQTDDCDTATVTVTPPTTPPAVTPPTTLPDTGAGNVVGIFAATVIAGAFGYRVFLSRKLSR